MTTTPRKVSIPPMLATAIRDHLQALGCPSRLQDGTVFADGTPAFAVRGAVVDALPVAGLPECAGASWRNVAARCEMLAAGVK